ncbi:anti-sigma factor family protein [Williamsia sp. SKLECPSW1]
MSDEQSAGPTVPIDLIADLHAGVLSAEEARTVRARVEADPASRRVLAALDATVADLRDAPVEPREPPPEVSARIDATLLSLRDEPPPAAVPVDLPPHPSDDPRVIALDAARDARRRRGMVIAAAVAVVVAVATGIIAVSTATQPSSDTVRADPTPSTGPSTPRGATGSPVSLLSVIGRSDPSLGSPTDPTSRLRGCLAANGVPASTAVVGAGPVEVDGTPRIVVLLTTGVAGRFDALVVGTDCAAGRASTVSRQVIGATEPTR